MPLGSSPLWDSGPIDDTQNISEIRQGKVRKFSPSGMRPAGLKETFLQESERSKFLEKKIGWKSTRGEGWSRSSKSVWNERLENGTHKEWLLSKRGPG